MNMAQLLDDITYRLLATASDAGEARQRLAIVSHWAQEQDTRLAADRPLRVDHERVVAEALAGYRRDNKPAA